MSRFEKACVHTPRFTIGVMLAGICLTFLAVAAADGTVSVRKWTPDSAAADLKRGSHVIFLQHAGDAIADRTIECPSAALGEEARSLALSIGDGFRRLGIPVARVLASEHCAAARTASLLGVGDVVVDPVLNPVGDGTSDAEQVGRLRQMISMEAPDDANVLLVSHRANINRVLNISNRTAPGTLYAFRRIDGKPTLVGSVKPEEWPGADKGD